MKQKKRSLYSVTQENIKYVFDNYKVCVISDDKRTLCCNNITIKKSLCTITDYYPCRTDKYNNVYNYFLITLNQDGVLIMTTVVNNDAFAKKIEKLYDNVDIVKSNTLQR